VSRRGHVDSRNSPAKIRHAKGAAPRSSTSLDAPSRYWKAPSYKPTANNERLAIVSLFPRPTSSIRHTRADCATSFTPRDLRDRARANCPRCRWQRDASSNEHFKILMMVRSRSKAADLRWHVAPLRPQDSKSRPDLRVITHARHPHKPRSMIMREENSLSLELAGYPGTRES
jgi:hypothetical protein